MKTVIIPENKYKKLLAESRAYKKIARQFFKNALKDTVGETVDDFRKSELYSEQFLKDLESGLRKSSYQK